MKASRKRLLGLWALFCTHLMLAQPSVIPGGPGPDSAQSSLFREADGTVHLTWSGSGLAEGERALWLASLMPTAEAWTPARPIVSTPLLMENWADFATMVVGSDGTQWAQWFQKRGEGQRGYDGWYARSTDAGQTWTTPEPLGHEFVSLAPLSGGRVMAVWLEKAPRTASREEDPHAPSMQLAARLLGPDGATLADWIVDPDVCTCCQTTLAVLPGDRLLVAYRGHTREEIRDNLVALFDGSAWQAPRILHPDGWMIPACPVNGPAADSTGEALAVAWYTAAQGQARVQVGFSPDGGQIFGPPQRVDLGRPLGRVDLVSLPDGSAVVSWLEIAATAGQADLYVQRFSAKGPMGAPLCLATLSAARSTGFPRMAVRDLEAGTIVLSYTDALPGTDGKPILQVRTVQFSAESLRMAPVEWPRRAAPPPPAAEVEEHNHAHH